MTNAPPPQSSAAAAAAVHTALYHLTCNRVIGTLIRRRVPDHLGDGAMRGEDLARAAGLHPLATVRALRFLAGFGLFSELSPGVFANNTASNLLRHRPGGLRNFAWWLTSDSTWSAIGSTGYSLETGKSSFQQSLKQSFWEFLRCHPEDDDAFNALFAELRGDEHVAIAKAYDWTKATTIVDIGGGNGSLLATILAQQSHLRGLLLDQDKVLPAAHEHLAARGVRDRCELVAGSFFDPLAVIGNVWILSQILHDWSDQECCVILGQCRAQMRPGDRLLVIEMVTVPCEPNMLTGLNDMLMLIVFGEGRQRTADEYRDLFCACGLGLTRVIPTQSPFSIVEAQIV